METLLVSSVTPSTASVGSRYMRTTIMTASSMARGSVRPGLFTSPARVETRSHLEQNKVDRSQTIEAGTEAEIDGGEFSGIGINSRLYGLG